MKALMVMKVFIAFVVFTCFTFPAFSQTNMDRFRALGDAIETSVSRSRDVLADYDSRDNDSDNLTRYSLFLGEYRRITNALNESEARLNFLLRNNSHSSRVVEEHRVFEGFLASLEALKTEYDAWLRTVQ